MRITKYIFFLLLIAKYGSSQTIINAERLISGSDSTIYAMSLSYNGTNGNSVTTQLNIAPSIIFVRAKNDYKILGGYSLLSEDNNGILNSGFVHLRHNYKIADRIKTFEFYQIQFNEVILLTKREVFGAGLRFNLIKKNSLKFDLEAGLMREMETLDKTKLALNETFSANVYRLTLVSIFKCNIGKLVRLNNISYYQPNTERFSDFRLLNELNLTFKISDNFELINALTIRYDSHPPIALKKMDTALSFGLNIKFNK